MFASALFGSFTIYHHLSSSGSIRPDSSAHHQVHSSIISGNSITFSSWEVTLSKPGSITMGTNTLRHRNIGTILCHNIFIPVQATPWKS
jgi:hypothetical protein